MGFVSQRFIPGFRLIDGSNLNTMIDQINAGIGFGSGPVYYVNSTIGSDTSQNNGQNPYSPLATLDRALEIESAALAAEGLSSIGRNAVVAFWGTQARTSTLAWNLPKTHLVGLGSFNRRGKRSRISVTGATGFNNLVSVTAQGCFFGNFGTFYGWEDAATALVCWSDTAGRSTYSNVEFLGFGDGTASTGSSNLTGSRAFKFNTDNGESAWYDCVFGVDTTTRDATNYTLELAGGAPRLTFENCDFEAYIGSSGASGSHLLIGASGIDRYVNFKWCRFMNATGSAATAMTQALNVSGSAGGMVLLQDCTSFGATNWETSSSGRVLINMNTPTAIDGGLAVAALPA